LKGEKELLQGRNDELTRNNQELTSTIEEITGQRDSLLSADEEYTTALRRQRKQAAADLAAARAETARVTALYNNTFVMRLVALFSRYNSSLLLKIKYHRHFHFSFFTFQFHKEYQG
jgi:hypothetical protein